VQKECCWGPAVRDLHHYRRTPGSRRIAFPSDRTIGASLRRVTIRDMDGVSHTVEVTAETPSEAMAQGLAAFRRNEWVAGVAEGLNVVKVPSRTFASSTSQANGFYEVA
jgi:hypothetical protein